MSAASLLGLRWCRITIVAIGIIFAWIPELLAQGVDQPIDTPAIPARSIDDQHPFRILVWQYQTEAGQDAALYQRVNLQGWHIDYGASQQAKAHWGRERGWPYYVDHAAGKGILHLTPRSGLKKIPRDGTPSPRPWSFFAPATLAELKTRLDRNVPPVINGPVLAIALDDEVSLGTFNSPLEVDFAPAAIAAFQGWLVRRYGSTQQLRSRWRVAGDEPLRPLPFEQVRRQIDAQPPSQWRLARWLDFRAFMDHTQASVFTQLVRHTNQLAPGVPVGVVGGQQPSAYGGFDYAKLRHAVQWMEAYDIGGTNEILRSFWAAPPRRPWMQTYFLSGNLQADKWFLWYYLAHGCRSVIAWPEIQSQPWFDATKIHPQVERLAETFQQVQSDALGVLTHPDTEPLFSPIAILYSHPSIQVGWAIDASAHGKTWPRRSSSIDNACLSSGKNRVAWTRLLEDLGHQARYIDPTELLDGVLTKAKIKVLILPQAFALSQSECRAIRTFVDHGGAVVADYGTAITDEHGNGYPRSPLDSLFGIDRSRDRGWFDGKRRYEINGERFNRPLVERLVQSATLKHNGLTVVERGLQTTVYASTFARGHSLFINSSPTAYVDPQQRAGRFGDTWRALLGDWLSKREVFPLVELSQASGGRHGVEVLPYRTSSGDEVWAIVTNPTRQAAVDGPGKGLELKGDSIQLRVEPGPGITGFKDLRTGKTIGFEWNLPVDEALVLKVLRE